MFLSSSVALVTKSIAFCKVLPDIAAAHPPTCRFSEKLILTISAGAGQIQSTTDNVTAAENELHAQAVLVIPGGLAKKVLLRMSKKIFEES